MLKLHVPDVAQAIGFARRAETNFGYAPSGLDGVFERSIWAVEVVDGELIANRCAEYRLASTAPL
jgi:hypothetical protein